MIQKQNFHSFSLAALEDFLESRGEKRFRARQLFQWVYEKNVTDGESMTNLSKDFRQRLTEFFDFQLPQMVDRRFSTDGTRKYLFRVGEWAGGGGRDDSIR